MIIIKLKGGLGNQLFQYATAKALALKHNTTLRLDCAEYEKDDSREYNLHHFKIEEKFYRKELGWLTKIKKKLKLRFYYREYLHGFNFNKDLEKLSFNKIFLDGYFQSELYFKAIRSELLELLKIKSPLKPMTIKMMKEMENSNSVSLHVRRGDYLLYDMHNTNKTEYYDNAMKYIESLVSNPTYFMFSDDIEWVKENFSSKYKMVFIDFNDDATNYEDIKLMSHCKHNIIANSSFSWWGAWLNTNPKKIVVAPEQWFNVGNLDYSDVVPDIWVKL